jgi:hypothetical protein
MMSQTREFTKSQAFRGHLVEMKNEHAIDENGFESEMSRFFRLSFEHSLNREL